MTVFCAFYKLSLQDLGKVKEALNIVTTFSRDALRYRGYSFTDLGLEKTLSLLQELKVDANDLSDILEKMGFDVGDVAKALEGVGTTGSKSTRSLGTAFSGLAAKIGISTAALGTLLGVAAGLAVVAVGVQMYNAHVQELVDNAREAASAFSESTSSLESYSKRVADLRTALDSGTLTEEEAYQAKAELLSIQESLSESYADQVEGIDLVNGSLKEQIGLIEQLSKSKANEYLNENRKAIAKAEKEMTKNIGIGVGGAAYLGSFNHGTPDAGIMRSILSKYRDYIKITGDGIAQNVYFYGDASEAKEVLNGLMTDLRNASDEFKNSNIFDSFSENASGHLNKANDILTKYQNIYEQAQQARLIADETQYSSGESSNTASKWLNEYAVAVKKYNEALASGDTTKIEEARISFEKIDGAISGMLQDGTLSAYSDQFNDIRNQLNETAIAQNDFIDAINGTRTIDGNSIKEYADSIKEFGLTDVDFKYAIATDGMQEGEESIRSLVDAAKSAGAISDESADSIQFLVDLLVEAGIITQIVAETYDELTAEFIDFAAYQEKVNSAIESSKSASGLATEEVTDLTNAYKDLESFNADKLFEETAHGIHLNKEELGRLNEELEANELQKYADEIKRIQEEIYLGRSKGEDTSVLESELEKARQLKLQYEALTSSYNKWLAAQSASNERDSYVGVGSSYEDMKAILDQGWYGDESLNAYLDLLLSADQRTGDAIADFAKLNETISGTSHSIMDYWQYDSDDNLVTDGLFDFLDDVNKKLGDSYATIDENGEYAFDFTGDKLHEVADAFGMSTEMVELFERAMIDAGMAVDMGDLTLVEQIEKATEKLKEFQEDGKISDSIELDFDVDMDPLEDVKSSIDNLKSERLKIDADADPELAALLDDLIAKCEEQYYFRLNAETDGGLDTAVALVREMHSLTATPLTVEAQIANEEKIAELAGQLAALPAEVQTAVGVKAENIGNVEGIINQLNSAPESITVPVNYTTGEYPETVEDATGVANYELGESPTEVPDATGVANFRLGSYPRSLPTINQYVRQVPLAQASGTAHADGTTINAHANGNDWTLPRDEDALVNEIGTESLVRNGKWHLIPGGAHIEKLKRGDIIFSAKQTDELLKTGKVISGGGHGRVALAGGTLNAYDSGSGGNRRPGSVSDYTSPSSTATNSTSTVDVDDELEKMDWIEVALDRIQRAIEKVKTTATSAYKSITTRLSASKDEISLITKEIGIQQSAYDRYMQEANSVGLSSDLANLVQTGAIDISQYDEETQELIKSYTEWFEKALDCNDAIQQLHEDLASLYEDNFNNIKDDFDNQLELLEHMTNTYENGIDMLEAQGYLQSTTYYAAMQDVERQNIAILNKELASLEKSFSEAMASGEIEEGSESWFAMQISINETKEAIDEANLSLAETAKAMREIEWDHFDYTQDRISQVTQESDFMIDLMSNSDMYDDKGQLTDNGMATMGLHGLNYNTYMAQADAYAQEILEINKQLAEDPYNIDLIERREELLELQQDSILAAEDEKQAIIDMVREGIEFELESLKELIDTYTDALDSAKDLYDYQRKVEEQSANIGNLKKQLSAYENDLSEETRATVQKLTVELAKAEDELAETEWERQISEQKKMLDMLYEEYSLVLNERLDNTEALLEEMIGAVNENSGSINTTLTEVADSVGYTMTESMQSIWNGSTEALDGIISTYGDDFGEKMTAANNVLSQIEANTAAMIANSGEQAEETVEDTTPTTDPDPDVTAPITSTEVNVDTNIEITPSSESTSRDTSHEADTRSKNNNGNSGSSATKPSLPKKSGKYEEVYFDDEAKTNVNSTTYKKYKGGGLADYTGVAWIDGSPSKPELVLDSKDTENFISLKETLRRMTEQGLTFGTSYGNAYVQQLSGITDISKKIASIRDTSGINNGITVGDTQVTIQIDHVEDYNDFVNKLRSDKKFEKMIQSMTIDRIVGGSPLAKNKYKW